MEKPYLQFNTRRLIIAAEPKWPMNGVLEIFALICGIMQSLIVLSLRKKLIRKILS